MFGPTLAQVFSAPDYDCRPQGAQVRPEFGVTRLRSGPMPMGKAPDEWAYGDLEAGFKSAAIVVEELVQLGVKRIVRVGTCGGLQADMTLGDLVLAISAVPADGTMLTYTGGEPHAPTADFELVHAAVHQAKHDGTKLRVGPCVSSGTFYDPDAGRAQRWSDRGVLAVEMEASILFTIAALRRVQAAGRSCG